MDWEAEGLLEGLEDDDAPEGPDRAARLPPRRGLRGRRAQAGGRGGPARAAPGRAPAGRRQDLQPAPDRRGGGARARPPAAVPPGARARGARPRRGGARRGRPRGREGHGRDRRRRLPDRGHARGHARARPRHGPLRRGAAHAVRRRRSSSRATPSSRSPAGSRARPRSCCRCRAACSTTCSSCTCSSCCATTSSGSPSAPSGKVSDRTETAVAFADLVGFTELGETVDVEELGGLAGRLSKMASEVVEQPVRVVKQIGDAVMFVSPDAEAAVSTLPRADRARRGRGELPAAARRRRLRPGHQPLGRLVRLDGQRREPADRPRAARAPCSSPTRSRSASATTRSRGRRRARRSSRASTSRSRPTGRGLRSDGHALVGALAEHPVLGRPPRGRAAAGR